MTCREWQRRIPDFLDSTMPVEEQEEFIAHVRVCDDCHEELEIMYMLAEGLEELENGTDNSYNFKRMLDGKLKKMQLSCDRHNTFLKIKELVLGIMYGVVVIGAIIQILEWM